MKKLILIPVFLTIVLLSSIFVYTYSSVKHYFDYIELAEDSEQQSNSSSNQNLLEEEEEHMIYFNPYVFLLIKSRVVSFFRNVFSDSNFVEVLTRPPIQ